MNKAEALYLIVAEETVNYYFGESMGKTILVVDDSSSMRRLTKLALTSAGHSVLEAVDGKAALDYLDGRSINMVICDVNMPNMNGIEFVQAARAKVPYRYLPILMLTTETQASAKEAGKAAGATGWMVKPFSASQLIRAVEKLSN